jgi:hypothetical protein
MIDEKDKEFLEKLAKSQREIILGCDEIREAEAMLKNMIQDDNDEKEFEENMTKVQKKIESVRLKKRKKELLER